MRPFSRRTVKQSSSAWVGCSWAPSPALMTGAPSTSAMRFGTPATAWRTTTASGSIASSVRAVSRMLSAFFRLELDGEKLITSADSRLPAISKEARVRVDDSKNRFTMVRPRSVGTFFTSRSPISTMCSAVSRMRSMSARSRSSMPSRSRPIIAPPSPAGVAAARETTITSSASGGPPAGACRRTSSCGCVGTFLPT